MDFIVNFILHIDAHLVHIINTYGSWAYVILFAIIFCETGLVVTPFLPGDTLLFAAGALAAGTSINVVFLGGILILAALCGDNVNYWLGRTIGPKVFQRHDSRIFKKSYLEKTHAFYNRYGGKTVVIARFLPIVRTFAPFVAGIGRMAYGRYIIFCLLGAVLWVGGILTLSYTFGNLPVIKHNFVIVVFTIIFLSILPAAIEVFRAKRA
ncbi:MAG: DedA family protein [Gammaproteobacteria bacterium]